MGEIKRAREGAIIENVVPQSEGVKCQKYAIVCIY